MPSDPTTKTASSAARASARAALEQAINRADVSGADQAATLHEQLSALCAQDGDYALALQHYQRFHRLSLSSKTPELLSLENLLSRTPSIANSAVRLATGLCMVCIHADNPPALTVSAAEERQSRLTELLLAQCRPKDLLAADAGAANLTLLLTDVDLALARKVCERLRAAWGQQQPGSTLSLGLTAWRGPGDDAQRLLARARAGLQAAAQAGGNSLRSGAD